MKVAIVEDDASAAERLRDCLQRYETEYRMPFEIAVYPNGSEFLENNGGSADIVFMDIDMPGMNGIQTSGKLRETDDDAIIIIVTDLAQYAIDGYSVNALDFVLKPVEYFSFKLKITKALHAVSSRQSGKITITNEEGTRYANISDIMYVEVQAHNLIYHLKTETVRTTGSLKSAEDSLKGFGFYRCNYCYLINLRYVYEEDGLSVKVGGDRLQISRNRRKGFLEALSDYYRKGGRFQ